MENFVTVLAEASNYQVPQYFQSEILVPSAEFAKDRSRKLNLLPYTQHHPRSVKQIEIQVRERLFLEQFPLVILFLAFTCIITFSSSLCHGGEELTSLILSQVRCTLLISETTWMCPQEIGGYTCICSTIMSGLKVRDYAARTGSHFGNSLQFVK